VPRTVTTEAVRADQRRMHLASTDPRRRDIAVGKPNLDTAPPTRAAACHFVPPCGTGVGNARCAPHSIHARMVHTRVHSTQTHPLPARLLSLAAPSHCDLSPAALLCDPEGVGIEARTRAETNCACYTDCLDCCCRLTPLLPPLALRKQKLRGCPETSWGKPEQSDFCQGVDFQASEYEVIWFCQRHKPLVAATKGASVR
jgi:hypothetical protein